MEKTQMLNVRVSPIVKQQAEDVLKQLGIPMATAIDMYLRQITLTGGIPFPLSLPKAPTALNADTMTDEQLHTALQAGIKEVQNGVWQPVFHRSGFRLTIPSRSLLIRKKSACWKKPPGKVKSLFTVMMLIPDAVR